MGKNKKNFYDEYDALFQKTSLKKQKKKNKKTVKKPNRKAAISWIVIILLLMGLNLYRKYFYFMMHPFSAITQTNNWDDEDDYDDWDEDDWDDDEIFPLKELGLKNSENRDLNKPLIVSLKDKTFDFSGEYQLTLTGDLDIALNRKELSLLPTNEDYPEEKRVADISIYNNKRYEMHLNMKMSQNIINSEEELIEEETTHISKAYPKETIDEVQTGIIFFYKEEENYNYTTPSLKRYFIFPNGTGISLRILSPDSTKKKFSKDLTLEEITKFYPKEMAFLTENCHFEKIKK